MESNTDFSFIQIKIIIEKKNHRTVELINNKIKEMVY